MALPTMAVLLGDPRLYLLGWAPTILEGPEQLHVSLPALDMFLKAVQRIDCSITSGTDTPCWFCQFQPVVVVMLAGHATMRCPGQLKSSTLQRIQLDEMFILHRLGHASLPHTLACQRSLQHQHF